MPARPATTSICRRSHEVLCMARSSSRTNGTQPAKRPIYWPSEQAEQLVDRLAAGDKVTLNESSAIRDVAAAVELTRREVRCYTVVLEAMEALRQAIAVGSPSSERNQPTMTAVDARQVLLQSCGMDEHLTNVVWLSLRLEADSTLTIAAVATAIDLLRVECEQAQLALKHGRRRSLRGMLEQQQAAGNKPADPASTTWWRLKPIQPVTPASRKKAAVSNGSGASDALKRKGNRTACRTHICVLGGDFVGLSTAVRLAEKLQDVKVTTALLTDMCAGSLPGLSWHASLTCAVGKTLREMSYARHRIQRTNCVCHGRTTQPVQHAAPSPLQLFTAGHAAGRRSSWRFKPCKGRVVDAMQARCAVCNS